MNQQQAVALAQGLIKILGAALTAHGATKAAAIINSEDVIGVVVTVAGLLWSHFYHGDAPTLARAQGVVADNAASAGVAAMGFQAAPPAQPTATTQKP